MIDHHRADRLAGADDYTTIHPISERSLYRGGHPLALIHLMQSAVLS